MENNTKGNTNYGSYVSQHRLSFYEENYILEPDDEDNATYGDEHQDDPNPGYFEGYYLN